MKIAISEKARSEIQKNLLAWYQKNKRNLPWRKKRSAYRTFISEVMLQQTQIKTVIPYFERWMKTFPAIQKLARARIGKVLKLWEGLGYYSRARNLHKAAKLIISKYGGKIPDDYETLLSLPGVGRYTAGAVASIAFGKPVPLVDGNVARVFSRIFYIRKDVLKSQTQKMLYDIAGELVPKKNAGEFNQALMELGSLVCFPVMPNCAVCPVQSCCAAYRKNKTEELPVKSKQAKKRSVDILAGVVLCDGKLFVRERPPKGIWGGLWELPNIISSNGGNQPKSLAAELEKSHGIKMSSLREKLLPIIHHLTHMRVVIHPYAFTVAGARGQFSNRAAAKVRWITKSDLNRLSFPVPYQKILRWCFQSLRVRQKADEAIRAQRLLRRSAPRNDKSNFIHHANF